MITPRKRFGQHFLRDRMIIANIVDVVQIQPDNDLIEVGPGEGVITEPMLRLCRQLIAIELDRDCCAHLRNKLANESHFHLLEADVLSVNFTELVQQFAQAQMRIVGNLPYNISTPLLFHLCQHRAVISDMHFMLQKEVVDRLSAQPGCKAYGRLSVMIQFYCTVTPLLDIPPHAFFPPPKVDSTFVRLVPYLHSPYPACDEKRFTDIVRLAFAHRRKTLANCLKEVITRDQLLAAGFDPSIRAENLSVSDFVRLALI